ncbi:hypothetical protein N7510_004430 [Penicillium lagena]|uniref:uncharacterized protein n=1 Tax=Penicillium lagena TaxID=94218 RepID=UPI0025422C60|nr:uncharacterized protein N7510_004430 [Penicillium lagena]KAJ5620446.1 hypothetical protein N7510_004430 [Penicillium lagena]
MALSLYIAASGKQGRTPHLATVHSQVFSFCAQLLILVRGSVPKICQESIGVVGWDPPQLRDPYPRPIYTADHLCASSTLDPRPSFNSKQPWLQNVTFALHELSFFHLRTKVYSSHPIPIIAPS